MIEVLIAALIPLAASALGYFGKSALFDRVSVRRIKSSIDKDIDGVIELYQELFPEDGTNYSPAETLEIMDQKFAAPRHTDVENVILIAKWRNTVVAFIFCHFYPERRKAIISYYGLIDDRSLVKARAEAPVALLKLLRKTLRKKRCDYIFFDLQGIDASVTGVEKNRRLSRKPAFIRRARQLGLDAYELHFPYVCPKASLTEEKVEYPFSLCFVQMRTQEKIRAVSKEAALDFIRFIYEDCYGDFYAADDHRYQEHHEYLSRIVSDYESTLPSEIKVG